MAHLYVIPGHGAGDPGACGNGYQEAERVRALAQRIKDFGGDDVTLHPFGDNAYASGSINYIDIPSDWQIVELHMDSAGSGARGGHVIINGNYPADEYDEAIADFIGDIFPGRSRTMVGRTDLANPNRAAARGIGYRLVENGFISDATDVEIFNDRIDDVAKAYLAAFGIGAGEAPAPTEPDYDYEQKPTPEYSGWCDSVRYRARVNGEWLDECINHSDPSGDGYAGIFGSPIDYITIDMPGRYRVRTQDNGWLPWVYSYDMNDLVDGCAGDGSPITAIECYYETQNPDETGWMGIEYAVHTIGGGWLPNMIDDTDTGGSSDKFAGNGAMIDGFRARIINL